MCCFCFTAEQNPARQHCSSTLGSWEPAGSQLIPSATKLCRAFQKQKSSFCPGEHKGTAVAVGCR